MSPQPKSQDPLRETGSALENEKNSAGQAAHSAPMSLVQVREQLKSVKGKKYWRSIDELANTEEFQAAVEREFPSAAQEWVDPVSRRGFLKLMGASMALAGMAGIMLLAGSAALLPIPATNSPRCQ